MYINSLIGTYDILISRLNKTMVPQIFQASHLQDVSLIIKRLMGFAKQM